MSTMIKKSRLALAIGLAGAVGLGAGSAMGAPFQASVNVQNTVDVENIANLNFGTVSVATAAGDADDPDDAGAEVAAMLLSPEGDVETGSTDDVEVSFLTLGEAAPAEALVTSSSDFTIEFPADSWIDDFDDDAGGLALPGGLDNGDLGTKIVNNGIRLSDANDNPGIPDFYLINFRVVIDTDDNDDEVTQGTSDTEWDVELAFQTEEVPFFIGGTLLTDPNSDDAYQETTYEGEFEVTARF